MAQRTNLEAVANGAVNFLNADFFFSNPQDGGREDFLKTYAPFSFVKTYQMNLLSARSIFLDSTIKN